VQEVALMSKNNIPKKLSIRQAVSTVAGLLPSEIMLMEVSLAEAVKYGKVRGSLVHDHPDKWRLDEPSSDFNPCRAIERNRGLNLRILMEGTVNMDMSTVETESFHAWEERTGDTPSPAKRVKTLKEKNRKQAEEYAAMKRKEGEPISNILKYLQNNYGYEGSELHDIIWPEDSEKTSAQKRKIVFIQK
jgi:hypothetical protein